jgi:hypothetical protein
MRLPSHAVLSFAMLLCVVLPTAAWAKDNPDRTQFNRDIRIEANEKTADATCINCSIYVRGQVAGDVTAIHGNIVLHQGASVAGDATTVLGNIRVEGGTSVAGDLTSVGGAVRRDSGASVAGDVTSLESKALVVLIIISPLVVLGLIIALVVWLVQRNRRTAPAPA